MKKFGLALSAVVLAATTFGAHASAASNSMTVKVKLTGMAESPMGAKHGAGSARFTFNVSKKTVCYSITVMGIKLPAAAAHIHSGKAGKNGPVLVPLMAPGKTGHSAACVHSVNASLIKGMMNHPTSYYLNVHTTNYPNGAVRGQL